MINLLVYLNNNYSKYNIEKIFELTKYILNFSFYIYKTINVIIICKNENLIFATF